MIDANYIKIHPHVTGAIGSNLRREPHKRGMQVMQVMIPPRKNRKSERTCDKRLYKLRPLMENAILHLKW